MLWSRSAPASVLARPRVEKITATTASVQNHSFRSRADEKRDLDASTGFSGQRFARCCMWDLSAPTRPSDTDAQTD